MIAPFTSEEANTGLAQACAGVLVRQYWHGGKAVATWLGWQEDGLGGHIPLWNLVGPLGAHPAGSTLSSETIAKLLGEEGE